MTAPTFTPGPWHVGEDRHGDAYIWGPDTGAKGCIARVNLHACALAEEARRRGNARLVAAAPEMLEALARYAEPALFHLSRIATTPQDRETFKKRFEEVRVIIAKARGEG